jgi:hypothetical protein
MPALEDAVLHCLKYSGQEVCGVFLGTTTKIEKCVPLFHTACVSVPMLRSCLSLLDEIDDMQIVGIYFASFDTDEISPVAKWLHSQIMKSGPYAELRLYKYNTDIVIEKGLTEFPFISYTTDGKSLKRHSGESLTLDRESFRRSVTDETYLQHVADFEDFMANPEIEWIRSCGFSFIFLT